MTIKARSYQDFPIKYDFNMVEFWPELNTGEALTQILCFPGNPPTENVTKRYVRNGTKNGNPAYLLHEYNPANNQQLDSWFIEKSPFGIFEYGDDFYSSGVFSSRVMFPINTLIWGGKQRVGDLDLRAADIKAASSINASDSYNRCFCQFQEHLFDFEDVMGNVWPEAVKVYNYQEFPRFGYGSPVGHHNVYWFAKDDQGRGVGHVQIDYRGNNNVSVGVVAIDQNRFGSAGDPLP